VSFLSHRDHPVAACTVFPDRRAASGALAGRDVVLPLSAARFPESFPELVRDSRSASAETAQQDALQAPQPQGEQKKVAFLMELLAVVQKALLAAAHWTPPLAAPPVMVVESV
jgi:hypothetical protein